MYVCMYVCLCVYVNKKMSICVCMYVCMSMCVCMCLCVCVQVCVYTLPCLCTHHLPIPNMSRYFVCCRVHEAIFCLVKREGLLSKRQPVGTYQD